MAGQRLATVTFSGRCPDGEKKDHHLDFSFSKKKMFIKSQVLKEKAKGKSYSIAREMYSPKFYGPKLSVAKMGYLNLI